MKTRRIRLRPGELERKGVGELKRLLEQLGVPTAVRFMYMFVCLLICLTCVCWYGVIVACDDIIVPAGLPTIPLTHIT